MSAIENTLQLSPQLISSKGMSAKENTLQLSPQFQSTSTSESKSWTKIKLTKIGKYIIYRKNIYTDFMKAIVILSWYFYL